MSALHSSALRSVTEVGRFEAGPGAATGCRLLADGSVDCAIADYDNDGDLDLVAANVGQPSRLYLNNGTGTFTDVTASHMPVDSDNTQSVALGDYDAQVQRSVTFSATVTRCVAHRLARGVE